MHNAFLKVQYTPDWTWEKDLVYILRINLLSMTGLIKGVRGLNPHNLWHQGVWNTTRDI